jgi:hypothetical protein
MTLNKDQLIQMVCEGSSDDANLAFTYIGQFKDNEIIDILDDIRTIISGDKWAINWCGILHNHYYELYMIWFKGGN